MGERISKIAIIGGGTAGWMTAAALSHALDARACSITLVESDDIGTIGVGEATIPTIHWFNQLVGLNEREFMKETQGSYKLGIEFKNWTRPNHRYFHPFGRYGFPQDGISFQHRWLRAQLEGQLHNFEDYSLNTVAALAEKFEFPATDPRSLLATLGYAYHFDASLYARHLRVRAEAKGVRRIEGKVERIEQHPESGFVTRVHTHRGEAIEAQLFIDCSGMRGLLIEGLLKTGFEDWSHWLPCDRAVAVASERLEAPQPFTRATQREAGWQWRIPLQHRTGNGYVFASRFISDDEAADVLIKNVEGRPLGAPRFIPFKAGKRRRLWNKNVVAIGLSGGFLEPLESTSIHFIQSGIAKLLSLFPTPDCDPFTVEQYNRICTEELNGVRDFLVLHYHATAAHDTPLWQHCRNMALPESLIYKEEQFVRSGRIVLEPEELFKESSWFAVLNGQGLRARDYNPLIDAIDRESNLAHLQGLKAQIALMVGKMRPHQAFLA